MSYQSFERPAESQGVALVLDANQRSALAVIRSLGSAGVRVLCADSGRSALGGWSRYSCSYLNYPDPIVHPDAFRQWVRTAVKTYRVDYVQPVTEVTSRTLLQGGADNLEPAKLPFPELDTVLNVADKGLLVDLARRLGLSIPRSRLFQLPADVDLSEGWNFPLVIKPTLSRILVDGVWHATSVCMVTTLSEINDALTRSVGQSGCPFLLQEYIAGYGAGVFALYDKGTAVAWFSHKRIRERPPSGGVSTLSESAPVDILLRSDAQRLLDAVGWHGVAMVEFRVTPEGVPYLMEVNTRFWGSLQLAVDSGVDFPWLLYCKTTGRSVSVPTGYRIGRRLRWFLGDVDSLYMFLRDRRSPIKHKALRLMAFLTPKPGSTRHEVFRWVDPMPGLFEFREYIRDLLN
jgi:predicted ATP-grasp superfamily ATP-dependent carboligase